MKNIRMSSEIIIRYYIWLLQQNDTNFVGAHLCELQAAVCKSGDPI